MTAPRHEVRTLVGAEEVAAAQQVFATALVGLSLPVDPEPLASHEAGRGLGVFDGEQLVGTAESFTSWLTVPGGARVPHAAVTDVGVLPSHTRRGIVSALMTRQLQDCAARGELVASLRASEAVIYERFGYGVATRSAAFRVSRRHVALRSTVPAGSPVSLADPEASEDRLRRIYDQANWVGAVARPDVWWRGRRLWAAARPGPRYLAVSGADGHEDGFALYRPAEGAAWFGGADRVIDVGDFVATSPEAYLGLLRHFAELDLTDAFTLRRPVDDPLGELFGDRRAVTLTGESDETWLRLLDVEAALSARTYSDGGAVVIAVSDPLLSENNASYRVASDGITTTGSPAELSCDVSALGAAYLGGVSWRTLALAGRVREHRRGAIADADVLFAVSPAPFAGTGF